MNIIFKTYLVDNVRLYTFGYVVYECLLFALFEWLKPKKVLRGLVYTALMVAVLFLGFQLLRAGFEHSGKSFINWFYVNRQEIGQIDEYFYFLFVGLGFFIISVLYYFTIVRYRSFGTMLVVLFPFFIYGKRADSMDTLDITIMLTVFIALMVHSRLVSDESKHDLVINGSYVAASAVFVTLVGALLYAFSTFPCYLQSFFRICFLFPIGHESQVIRLLRPDTDNPDTCFSLESFPIQSIMTIPRTREAKSLRF